MTLPFGYTCEQCGDIAHLTVRQFNKITKRTGKYVCLTCAPKPKPKRKRNGHNSMRNNGCIVTIRYPDGHLGVQHRHGHSTEALRDIVSNLPDGSKVMSISTPRTILRDIQPHNRLTDRSRTVEHVMLSKLGRQDLLP